MIKVIEASNDQELALKVTEAINAGTLPYGDWDSSLCGVSRRGISAP